MPTIESGYFQKAIDAGDFPEKIQSLFKKCLEDQVNSRSFTECIEEAYTVRCIRRRKNSCLYGISRKWSRKNYYDFEEAVQGLCKYYEKNQRGQKKRCIEKRIPT